MSVYERLQSFFNTAPDSTKYITLSFDQVKIILGENLPIEAYKESIFWNNNPINANGPSRTWLEAGWKTEKVNLFERRVDFVKSGEEIDQPKSSYIERVREYFKPYLIKWFNHYPADREHYIGIVTHAYKTYWMIIDENTPYEIYIDRFGKQCGSIKFTCDGKSIELHDIFIFKRHRGVGLGSYAMKYFLIMAKNNGFDRVEAGVQPEEDFPLKKLLSWYEKFGFKATPPGSRWMILEFNKYKQKRDDYIENTHE